MDQEQEADEEEVGGTKIKLSELGEAAIAASRNFDRAANWRWIDAVAWVARRDPELMALVRGYRFFIRQHMPTVSEGASMIVARQNISTPEWQNASQILRQALEDGRLPATEIESGASIGAGFWSDPPVDPAGDMPSVFLPAPTVMELWPASASDAGDAEPEGEAVKLSPSECPSEWWDLRRTFKRYGNSAVGYPMALSCWSNVGVDDLPDPYPSMADFGSWPAPTETIARFYSREVARSFSFAAEAGRLRTCYARKGGGALHPLHRSCWRTDDRLFHFRRWGINPVEELMFSPASEPTHWIFVHREDLSKMREELADWRRSLPDWNDVKHLNERGVFRLGGMPVIVEIDDDGSAFIEAPEIPHIREAKPAAPEASEATAAAESVKEETAPAPKAAAATWQRRLEDTPARRAMSAWLPFARNAGYLQGGEKPRTLKRLHESYVDRCKKERLSVEPLKFSAFKKWMKRHYEGEWS